MRNELLAIALAAMSTAPLGCTGARAAQAQAAQPATSASPKAPPTAHNAPELFAAIHARDTGRVRGILADAPQLAAARSPSGSSAALVAAFTLNDDEETFVKASDNAMLRAVLEARPPLDVFDAAIAGDVARLGALIAADGSLANATHAKGGKPLHFAAFADRTAAVELLLAHGARIEAVAENEFRNTPLVLSMLGDAVGAATLLVARGANVEAAETGGLRALHIAAELGDAGLVGLLLDHHAQVDARADDGSTPLSIAVKRRHDEAARLLRAHGGR